MRLGRGADPRHGFLRGHVDPRTERVDLVGDILLGRGFQRVFKGFVEHDPLFGVDRQLVDQGVLRRDLVVEGLSTKVWNMDV